MSSTCVDCGTAVNRLFSRGPVRKRCEKCRKKKAIHNAESWRARNPEKAAPHARKPDFGRCVDCGAETVRTGIRGPVPRRCDPCLNVLNQARHKRSYEQSKSRHNLTCEQCKKAFCCPRANQRYCSEACRGLACRKRVTCKCQNERCGKIFEAHPHDIANGRRFCCRDCSYYEQLVCQNPACGRKFRMKHRTKDGWKNKGKYCCPECYRDHRWGVDRPRLRRSKLARSSASRNALARSLRKRCKVYGVTFDPACTRQAVLERDGWVCQKCRAVCHKEYVLHAGTLTPDLRNAEHDHIWPLSVKGSPGNVFENSQCLCRKCNLAKGDTVEGQLRLCLEEEAWGKGVRVRSQHNSRSCVATQVVGHSISRSRSRHPMAL